MWLTNGIQQWPQLSRQHLLYCIIHHKTKTPHNVQWNSLEALNRRPQDRTLNFLSIPLPVSSNDESGSEASDAPAEVIADSPHIQDESPTCSPRARPTQMTRGTSKPTEMTPSIPDGLLTKDHNRSHQCAQDEGESTPTRGPLTSPARQWPGGNKEMKLMLQKWRLKPQKLLHSENWPMNLLLQW